MERLKYLFGILTAALCTLTGCSDEQDETGFHIIKAEINFDAVASQGYVQVSDADCKAEVTADWCHVERQNDRILVSVDDNGQMEGRTTLLTLTAAGGIQKLPVSQKGSRFRVPGDHTLTAGDAACTVTVPVDATFAYQVDTHGTEWLAYEQDGDGVKFRLNENTTATPRIASVRLYCPTMDKEIHLLIPQYEVKDLMGGWTATYNVMDRNTVVQTSSPVTLTLNADNEVELTGIYNGLTLLAQVNDRTIAFPTGRSLGTFRDRYEAWQWGANANFQMTTGTDEPQRLYAASLALETLSAEGIQSLTFQADAAFDNGTAMTGLGITATPLDESGTARNVTVFTDLTLRR